MAPVRWGILGTARIARVRVIPGMRRSRDIEILAMASRSQEQADATARELSIPRAYGSYEALLADPDIEAVYIPLPNHLHVPYTQAAVAAGKAVLCEKPIAITAAEAEALRALPAGAIVAEAFMVRHHPQWIQARRLVREGAIGAPRVVQVSFGYSNLDAGNIRNNPQIGGGALLDIGCYALVAARYIFGAEPLAARALQDRDPRFGTDRITSGMMDFGEGRHLSFSVSTQVAPHQRVEILGTTGRIMLPVPFNPPQGEATTLLLDDGSALGGASARNIPILPADQYQLQGEWFGRVLRGEEPLEWGVEDAIANMRGLDALRA